MSPRLVCALEKFKECSKSFRQNRPWQKCCCKKHTERLRWLLEKKAMRRRKANKRTQAASNARTEHSKRFARKGIGRTASLRTVLEGLAERRPEFFLRLAGSIPKAGKSLAGA